MKEANAEQRETKFQNKKKFQIFGFSLRRVQCNFIVIPFQKSLEKRKSLLRLLVRGESVYVRIYMTLWIREIQRQFSQRFCKFHFIRSNLVLSVVHSKKVLFRIGSVKEIFTLF